MFEVEIVLLRAVRPKEMQGWHACLTFLSSEHHLKKWCFFENKSISKRYVKRQTSTHKLGAFLLEEYMEEANKEQKKIMAELDYKINEYYKTHNEESDELYRIQAHYHKKIKEAGKK